MGNLMRRWLKRDDETTPAELDAMAVPEGDDRAEAVIEDITPDPVIEAALDAEIESTKALLEQDDARLAEEILNLSQHPLDIAPIGSKLVMVIEIATLKAVLAMPSSLRVLPRDDPAYALPEGARIQKTGEHEFTARQLSPTYDADPLITSTANDAIRRFVGHFHPRGA